MRTVALPEATGLAVLWLGGRLVLGVWPASVLWLGGRLVRGVWPASLLEASCVGRTTGPGRLVPEACHVVWTSGPGRLARLFEASWVELIAAPVKSDKPSAPPRPRPCLLLEREDLARRILEETLYAPGHPPQGPR